MGVAPSTRRALVLLGAGLAFMAAGNHMRDSEGRIDNYWRVIHNGGSVPANFRAPADRGPKDSYSAMQRLMKEGVGG